MYTYVCIYENIYTKNLSVVTVLIPPHLKVNLTLQTLENCNFSVFLRKPGS